MDVERLVKFSRDNIPAGKRSQGRPKRRWSDKEMCINMMNRLGLAQDWYHWKMLDIES